MHAARTGVVGGGRKAEIAELLAQLAQKLRRFRQRLYRIERIEQAALSRRTRHELRNALRPLAAAGHRTDRIGAKAALLPDHAREELQRQVGRPRRRFDHQAHRLSGLGFPLRLRRLGLRDRKFLDTRLDVTRRLAPAPRAPAPPRAPAMPPPAGTRPRGPRALSALQVCSAGPCLTVGTRALAI